MWFWHLFYCPSCSSHLYILFGWHLLFRLRGYYLPAMFCWLIFYWHCCCQLCSVWFRHVLHCPRRHSCGHVCVVCHRHLFHWVWFSDQLLQLCCWHLLYSGGPHCLHSVCSWLLWHRCWFNWQQLLAVWPRDLRNQLGCSRSRGVYQMFCWHLPHWSREFIYVPNVPCWHLLYRHRFPDQLSQL